MHGNMKTYEKSDNKVIDECRQNIASDQFMIGRLQQEIDLLKKIIEKEESCIEQQGESQDTEGKAAATSSNVGTSPTAVTGTTQKRNTAKRTPAATSIAAVIDSKKKPTAKRTATSLTSVKDSKKPATESPATSLTSVKDSKKPATESPATSLISVKDSKEPATESPATSLTAVKDSKKPATESPATSLTEVKDTEAQEVTKERPASPLTAVKDTEAQDTSLRRSNRIRSRGEKRPLPQRVPTKSKKKKVEQATTEKEEPVPTQPQAAKPVEAPKKPTSTLPPPQRQAAPSAREKPIATHTVTADSQSRPSPRKQAATPPQRQAAPEQPIAMPTVPADPPASLPIPHSPAEQSLTIKNPSPTKLPKPAHSTEVPKTSTPRKKTATPTATPTKQPTRADATETNKATKPKSKKETPTATPTKQTTKADATETVKAPTPTKQPTTRDATETVKAPTPTKQPTTADATETVKAPKKTTSDDKPRAEGLTKSQRTFSGHVNRILLNSNDTMHMLQRLEKLLVTHQGEDTSTIKVIHTAVSDLIKWANDQEEQLSDVLTFIKAYAMQDVHCHGYITGKQFKVLLRASTKDVNQTLRRFQEATGLIDLTKIPMVDYVQYQVVNLPK